MPIDVTMPKLSLAMAEGALVEWYVNVGDRVSVGMPLAAIETDKLATVLECPASGLVAELFVTPGTIAHIGQRLAAIDDER